MRILKFQLCKCGMLILYVCMYVCMCTYLLLSTNENIEFSCGALHCNIINYYNCRIYYNTISTPFYSLS